MILNALTWLLSQTLADVLETVVVQLVTMQIE